MTFRAFQYTDTVIYGNLVSASYDSLPANLPTATAMRQRVDYRDCSAKAAMTKYVSVKKFTKSNSDSAAWLPTTQLRDTHWGTLFRLNLGGVADATACSNLSVCWYVQYKGDN